MLYGASIMEAFNVNNEFGNMIEKFENYTTVSPQESKPQESKPQESKPQESKPQESKPQEPELQESPTSTSIDVESSKDEDIPTVTKHEFNNLKNNLESTLNNNLDSINIRINDLLNKIETNQNNNTKTIDLFDKNIHDIVLFIIFGIFIILLLEGIFKLVKIKLGKK